MSSSLRRGALVGAAVVFSIASLSACGAGTHAQTLEVKPDNPETAIDSLKLQNGTVITQPERDAEGPAAVAVTVFNNGVKPQTLESITLSSGAKAKLSPATGSGPITVPALGRVVFGGKGNASAIVENGNQSVKVGGFEDVVFRFSETGDVKMQVLVLPARFYFTGFGPSNVPKPPVEKPSGSPAALPHTTPSGSPSGSPSEAAGSEAEAPAGAATASHSEGH
ncbi:DUF461 domain-containing protein [Streptomyces sp. NPDC002889]|uniref:DUF461 domain-containing protein n=1 Tax=Streptomyces sp. NPDC002889 TaxID=3364669 RepID=UPI00368CFAF1